MKKFKWNKWAIVIAVMICGYVAFGGVAIGVYARDGRPGEKEAAADATLQAEAPTEEDYEMTDEEYREFMKMYGSAATETETETEESQAAGSGKQDLSGYQTILEQADQALKDALEEAKDGDILTLLKELATDDRSGVLPEGITSVQVKNTEGVENGLSELDISTAESNKIVTKTRNNDGFYWFNRFRKIYFN